MLDDELIANLDEMNQTAVLDEILVDDMAPNNIDIDDQQSQRYQHQLKSMSITKHIMTRLGWTDCDPNTFQDSGVLTSYEPVSGICIWK